SGRARKVRTGKVRSFDDLSDLLLANFIGAIEGRAAPLVSAADVRHSVAVIDACYARRRRFPEPWHEACARLAHV
ncbi:MAG TPA: hypothetical protein VGC20_15535, partial [bacterium]